MSQPSNPGGTTRVSANPTTPSSKPDSTKPSGSRGSGPQQSISSPLMPPRNLNRYDPRGFSNTPPTVYLAPKPPGEIFPPRETTRKGAEETKDMLDLVKGREEASRDAATRFGSSRWAAFIPREKPSENQE